MRGSTAVAIPGRPPMGFQDGIGRTFRTEEGSRSGVDKWRSKRGT
jgi:hypothetical protein